MLRNAEQRLLAIAKRRGALPDGETFEETDDIRLRNDWFELADKLTENSVATRAALYHSDHDNSIERLITETVLNGYLNAPDSTAGWVREVPLTTFGPSQIAIADSAVRFKQYGRGGVSAKITVSMHNEEWRLSRYAMHFEIDEQDVIDFQSLDTLRILLDRMGADSRALVPDLVYSALLKNATLEDDLPLFHADRLNLGTGGGSAIGDASLDTGIGAIGSQVLYDHLNDPIHVNLAANYLMVPPTKLGLAKRLARNMSTGSGDLIVRPESRLLDVGIVDPQTDSKIAGNGTNWLLAAASQQAPSVLLGFLDGNNKPVTRVSRLTQGSWGMSIDIVFDVGVSVVDGRPLYWATGQ